MTSTTHLNVITLTLVITYQLNQLNQITRLTGDPSIYTRVGPPLFRNIKFPSSTETKVDRD